jgi:hypothetical protein
MPSGVQLNFGETMTAAAEANMEEALFFLKAGWRVSRLRRIKASCETLTRAQV